MFEILIPLAFLVLLIVLVSKKNVKKKNPLPVFPMEWKTILQSKVKFYISLDINNKILFENRILRFLNTTRITGIDCEVDDTVRLLVASSAIIPVFAFPDWEYINLKEVLIYPSAFNENFEYKSTGSRILGMVGSGYMEGKMILSKPTLINGFENPQDKKNVGLHEFAHLIDKSDGKVDGIPEVLIKNQFAIPWINLVKQKMEEIHALKSDINPYGGVAKEEFFSVITEYFFERPKLLKTKHPELYRLLSFFFSVDLSKADLGNTPLKKPERNDPCYCGSGNKFKNCCGKQV
ncbi:MAG: zinc-dependent peptidase [Bacteroidales bacterium]|nr:zinc-dependent peptidase [Bacteroidales bacterium]MBN2821538.1 zinc-dependent peptidase [Bacteroidales bacterium]